jgi:hypothetical protein
MIMIMIMIITITTTTTTYLLALNVSKVHCGLLIMGRIL